MHHLTDRNKVAQIGIVVRDIERAAADYAAFFGMDKPGTEVSEPYEQAQTEYKGKPTQARAKMAFFDLDNIQLELIEPDEHPSTWREFLDTRGEGIHHVAFFVKGMKAKVELYNAEGMPLVQRGEYTGGRYSYLESNESLKTIVELLEND